MHTAPFGCTCKTVTPTEGDAVENNSHSFHGRKPCTMDDRVVDYRHAWLFMVHLLVSETGLEVWPWQLLILTYKPV